MQPKCRFPVLSWKIDRSPALPTLAAGIATARYAAETRRGKTDMTAKKGRAEKAVLSRQEIATRRRALADKRMKAGKGVVAVDPRFIKLGTKLYVVGYGYCIAGDTGGAIKGNRIDLGFNTYREAVQFGRRTVTVFILN